MKIKTKIKYYKEYIPYRCRKPRYEEVDEIVDANIKETTMDNLKLKYVYDWCEHYDLYEYNGKLYRVAEINDICSGGFDTERYSTVIEAIKWWNLNGSCYYSGTHQTREEILKKVKTSHSKYLLVDGILYVREYKPLYHICTFGLGNNHGGTGWMITTSPMSAKKLNNEYKQKCYFEPEEYEESYLEAIRVAQNRGDTESVKMLEKYHKTRKNEIKILN